MKTLLILSLIFTAASYGESNPKLDEIDKKIRDTLLSPAPHDSDITWITEEVRPIVISKLLQRVNNPYEGRNVEEALVKSGHLETIQKLIEELKQGNHRSDALSFASEIAIPYLMPIVYTGSTEQRKMLPGEDIMFMPVRDRAIGHVLGKIMKSNNFPLESRKWAEEMGFHGIKYKDEKYVALVTSWWENNQTAILEERYADATWLPRYKSKPITFNPREAASRKAYEENERITRRTKRPGGDDSETISNATTPYNWQLWSIIAVIASLLGISIFRKLAWKA